MNRLFLNRWERLNLAQLIVYNCGRWQKDDYKNKDLQIEIRQAINCMSTFLLVVMESGLLMDLIYFRSDKHRNMIYGWGQPGPIDWMGAQDMAEGFFKLFSKEEIEAAKQRRRNRPFGLSTEFFVPKPFFEFGIEEENKSKLVLTEAGKKLFGKE